MKRGQAEQGEGWAGGGRMLANGTGEVENERMALWVAGKRRSSTGEHCHRCGVRIGSCGTCEKCKKYIFSWKEKNAGSHRNQPWYLKRKAGRKGQVIMSAEERAAKMRHRRSAPRPSGRTPLSKAYYDEIALFYKNKPRGMDVDHIIPLRGGIGIWSSCPVEFAIPESCRESCKGQ